MGCLKYSTTQFSTNSRGTYASVAHGSELKHWAIERAVTEEVYVQKSRSHARKLVRCPIFFSSLCTCIYFCSCRACETPGRIVPVATSLYVLASVSDAKLPLDTIAKPQHVAIGRERERVLVPAKHLMVWRVVPGTERYAKVTYVYVCSANYTSARQTHQ